jgi:undecaprenyl-diphosphatase
LAAAAVLSALTYVGAAIGQMGAVSQRLALARTTAVQVASSFVNRLTPGNVGGLGINVRYLVNAGIDRSEAIAAVALNTVAGVMVHVAALVVALGVVSTSEVGDVKLPSGWPVATGVALTLAALGIVLWSPLGRRRLGPPLVHAAKSIGDVVRQPGKAAGLFGGSVLLTGCYALALVASLEAFNADVALAHVIAVYLGSAAIASLSPTPGGLGAMEAALAAGLTAVGVAHGPAIAGVLTFRLVTYWAPILPGWVAYRVLRRSGVV